MRPRWQPPADLSPCHPLTHPDPPTRTGRGPFPTDPLLRVRAPYLHPALCTSHIADQLTRQALSKLDTVTRTSPKASVCTGSASASKGIRVMMQRSSFLGYIHARSYQSDLRALRRNVNLKVHVSKLEQDNLVNTLRKENARSKYHGVDDTPFPLPRAPPKLEVKCSFSKAGTSLVVGIVVTCSKPAVGDQCLRSDLRRRLVGWGLPSTISFCRIVPRVVLSWISIHKLN